MQEKDFQLHALFNEYKADPDVAKRNKIIQAMAKVDKDRAYQFLLDQLDDSDNRMIGFAALNQVYSLPSEEVIQRGFDKLLDIINCSDEVAKKEAIKVLPRLRYRSIKTYTSLFKIIKSEPNSSVRISAIVAIMSVSGITKMERKDLKPLADLLMELYDQEDFKKSAENTLQIIGYDVKLIGTTCCECGLGQPEARLSKCIICGDIICSDHGYKTNFCSKDHFKDYNIQKHGANPRYW